MANWKAKAAAATMAIASLTTHNGFAQEHVPPLAYPPLFVQPSPQSSSSILTLHNTRMLDDLELVESQRKAMQTIRYENDVLRSEKLNALMNRFAKLTAANNPNPSGGPIPFDARSPAIQSALNKVERECDRIYAEKIDEVFLPHQRARFRELQARTEFAAVLNGKTRLTFLVESVGITDDQLAEIKETAPEFDRKLEREIAKLREKRHLEYWQSVLTDEQMKKLQNLLGDPLTPVEAGTNKSHAQNSNSRR